MKTCDICGTVNFNENNYCTHCGNKFLTEHSCPYCGEIIPDYETRCPECKNPINPIFIDNFDVLFSRTNEDLLANAVISDEEYFDLLRDIFAPADYLKIYGNTVKNKIINLANVFAKCQAKSRGYERGYILANGIFYDDRLDDSVQIATIIHELAHYFLFTIIENLLCRIFNVISSSTIQSFAWYFLTIDEFRIMNEYCAHTVEGRFIPYGYQNYESFNVLVESNVLDDSELKTAVILGNTFANEIIVFLEKYIDEELREEIKQQYKKDSISPNNESILKETTVCIPSSQKNDILMKMMYNVLKEASDSFEAQNELEDIKEGIEMN